MRKVQTWKKYDFELYFVVSVYISVCRLNLSFFAIMISGISCITILCCSQHRALYRSVLSTMLFGPSKTELNVLSSSSCPPAPNSTSSTFSPFFMLSPSSESSGQEPLVSFCSCFLGSLVSVTGSHQLHF